LRQRGRLWHIGGGGFAVICGERQVVVYRDSRMAGLDLSMGKPSLPSWPIPGCHWTWSRYSRIRVAGYVVCLPTSL